MRDGKVVSPTHRSSLPQGGFLVLVYAKMLSRNHGISKYTKSKKNVSNEVAGMLENKRGN